MTGLSLPSISAAGYSLPIGNYTPAMRRAVLALQPNGAIFLPGRGGWVAGEIVIEDVTMRALSQREDVRLSMTRQRRNGRARLTPRGEATLAAIRRAQQSTTTPEVQR